MEILIGGSSGFLAQNLTTELQSRGHHVTGLVRREAGADESRWDPYTGEIDQAVVDRADVVFNLAGSPTAGNPYSKKWADELRRSRVTTTQVLADAIARAHRDGTGRPEFLAGNAVGFYGDHGSEVVDESSDSRGDSLLSEVTKDWQAATESAAAAGARVCVLRTAPVIDRTSQPLKQMLFPFRLGIGTRLGSGEQYFPCISLRDWVAGAIRAAEDPGISGPVNLCCPNTPTNAEFTDALAAALGRKARLKVPAFLLEKAAGPMAPELLGSVRVRPAVLLDAGHEFTDSDIVAVVAAALQD